MVWGSGVGNERRDFRWLKMTHISFSGWSWPRVLGMPTCGRREGLGCGKFGFTA